MLIPVFRRLFCVTVSPEDFDYLAQFRWTDNHGYIRRRVGGGYIWLHHEVLTRMGITIPHDMETDHIDNNPLNNVRSNLRVVSHARNLGNRMPRWVRSYNRTAH